MGRRLRELYEIQARWSQATFGHDDLRGPTGPLKHLIKEVEETLENPDDIFEFADCLGLLLDALRRGKHTLGELLVAYSVNLRRNELKRTWPSLEEQDPDGPVMHHKPAEPEPDDPLERIVRDRWPEVWLWKTFHDHRRILDKPLNMAPDFWEKLSPGDPLVHDLDFVLAVLTRLRQQVGAHRQEEPTQDQA